MTTTEKCPDCGAAVLRARATDGQTVLLDAEAPSYHIMDLPSKANGGTGTVERNTLNRVDHARVCPKRRN